jgi:predicted small secreted protein
MARIHLVLLALLAVSITVRARNTVRDIEEWEFNGEV